MRKDPRARRELKDHKVQLDRRGLKELPARKVRSALLGLLARWGRQGLSAQPARLARPGKKAKQALRGLRDQPARLAPPGRKAKQVPRVLRDRPLLGPRPMPVVLALRLRRDRISAL